MGYFPVDIASSNPALYPETIKISDRSLDRIADLPRKLGAAMPNPIAGYMGGKVAPW